MVCFVRRSYHLDSEDVMTVSGYGQNRLEEGECRFVADLDGRLNAALVRVVGAGTVNEDLGITLGSYNCDLGNPDIDLRLLSVCLITGYPNVCAEAEGIHNPFRGTSYNYERDVLFSSGERFHVSVGVSIADGCLRSRFRVDGTAPVRTIGAPQPLAETWRGTPDRRIDGNFDFGWVLPEGIVTRAIARSTYVLASGETASLERLRQLEINATVTGQTLSLEQRSRLVG